MAFKSDPTLFYTANVSLEKAKTLFEQCKKTVNSISISGGTINFDTAVKDKINNCGMYELADKLFSSLQTLIDNDSDFRDEYMSLVVSDLDIGEEELSNMTSEELMEYNMNMKAYQYNLLDVLKKKAEEEKALYGKVSSETQEQLDYQEKVIAKIENSEELSKCDPTSDDYLTLFEKQGEIEKDLIKLNPYLSQEEKDKYIKLSEEEYKLQYDSIAFSREVTIKSNELETLELGSKEYYEKEKEIYQLQLDFYDKKGKNLTEEEKKQKEYLEKLIELNNLYIKKEENNGFWNPLIEKELKESILQTKVLIKDPNGKSLATEDEIEFAKMSKGERNFEYTKTFLASAGTGVGKVAETLVDGLVMGIAIAGKGENENFDTKWAEDFVSIQFAKDAYDSLVASDKINEVAAYSGVHDVGDFVGSAIGYACFSFIGGPYSGIVTPLLSGISGIGSASESALNSGASFEQAAVASLTSGALAAVTAIPFGGNGKVVIESGKQLLKRMAMEAGIAMVEPNFNSLSEYYIYAKEEVDEYGEKVYSGYWDYYKKTGVAQNTAIALVASLISSGADVYSYGKHKKTANFEVETIKNVNEAFDFINDNNFLDPDHKLTNKQLHKELIKKYGLKKYEADYLIKFYDVYADLSERGYKLNNSQEFVDEISGKKDMYAKQYASEFNISKKDAEGLIDGYIRFANMDNAKSYIDTLDLDRLSQNDIKNLRYILENDYNLETSKIDKLINSRYPQIEAAKKYIDTINFEEIGINGPELASKLKNDYNLTDAQADELINFRLSKINEASKYIETVDVSNITQNSELELLNILKNEFELTDVTANELVATKIKNYENAQIYIKTYDLKTIDSDPFKCIDDLKKIYKLTDVDAKRIIDDWNEQVKKYSDNFGNAWEYLDDQVKCFGINRIANNNPPIVEELTKIYKLNKEEINKIIGDYRVGYDNVIKLKNYLYDNDLDVISRNYTKYIDDLKKKYNISESKIKEIMDKEIKNYNKVKQMNFSEKKEIFIKGPMTDELIPYFTPKDICDIVESNNNYNSFEVFNRALNMYPSKDKLVNYIVENNKVNKIFNKSNIGLESFSKIERYDIEHLSKIVKKMDASTINYFSNYLEVTLKNKLALDYGIKEMYNKKNINLEKYINDELSNLVENKLGKYLSIDKLKEEKKILLYEHKRFLDSGRKGVLGYYDGINFVIDVSQKKVYDTIIHEYIHKLSHNGKFGGFKLREAQIKIGLNECMTEYIAQLVFYDTVALKNMDSDYSGGVLKLKKLISSDIVDEGKLIQSYFNNDISYLEREITSLVGKETYDELIEAFDDAISDNMITMIKGLKNLDKIIAKLDKAKWGG